MHITDAPISASNTQARLLTPEQAAEFLQVSPATLAVWRCNQRYNLPYYKMGDSLVRYKLEDLEAFASADVQLQQ